MKFFLDTYALVEISKGNKNFEKYIDSDVMTLKLNIAELYYSILVDFNDKTADYFFKKFSNLAFALPLEFQDQKQ